MGDPGSPGGEYPSPSAFAPIAGKIPRLRLREALVALAGLDGPWQTRRDA